MKRLLISIGLLVAAFCPGCCRPGGLFNQPSYGYYGSYPMAAPLAAPAPTYSSYPANCTCQ